MLFLFFITQSIADDIDAGVYARLVLASADGVTGADKVVAGKKNGVSTTQLTPSGAVKPATTSGSSSRRRLTSLSLRSAGYNDADDVVPTTKGSVYLAHLNKVPTSGSTMHTRSTSSFSSWSVGSLNAPREVRNGVKLSSNVQDYIRTFTRYVRLSGLAAPVKQFLS